MLNQLQGNGPWGHPAAQLAAGQLQLIAHGEQFDAGLNAGFAQIAGQGLKQGLFQLLEQGVQLAQLLQSPRQRPGLATPHQLLHRRQGDHWGQLQRNAMLTSGVKACVSQGNCS